MKNKKLDEQNNQRSKENQQSTEDTSFERAGLWFFFSIFLNPNIFIVKINSHILEFKHIFKELLRVLFSLLK